jgi:vacuolar-type H+-ATPase subunit H
MSREFSDQHEALRRLLEADRNGRAELSRTDRERHERIESAEQEARELVERAREQAEREARERREQARSAGAPDREELAEMLAGDPVARRYIGDADALRRRGKQELEAGVELLVRWVTREDEDA